MKKDKVHELIEMGGYFQKAQNWFYLKYLSQYKERAILIVLTISLGFLLFLTAEIVTKEKTIFGKQKHPIYYIQSNDEPGKVATVTSVPDHYHMKTHNITRYMLERYLMEFESHNYTRSDIWSINDKTQKISRYSATKVLKKFKTILNTKYSKDILRGDTRYIKIIDFSFPGLVHQSFSEKFKYFIFPEEIPTIAVVTVETYRKNLRTHKIFKRIRYIYLHFKIEIVQKGHKGHKENQILLKIDAYKYIKKSSAISLMGPDAAAKNIARTQTSKKKKADKKKKKAAIAHHRQQ